MFSRTPRGTTGRLSCQFLQPCHEIPLTILPTTQHPNTRCKSTSGRPPRPPPSRLPRSTRHHKRPHPRTASQHVPLDVSFLGEQGNVVVVPERRRRRTNLNPAKFEPEELRGRSKEASRPLMLEEIEKKMEEEEGFDTELVYARIEGCRAPREVGDVIAAVEWEELRGRVEASFTGSQLAGYIKDNKGQSSPSSSSPSALLHLAGEGEGATPNSPQSGKVKVGEWKPGTSKFLDNTAVVVSKRIAGNRLLKGKQFLAERVLRECWKLGVEGEVGQLDIRLSPSYLSLLSNSKHFSFGELANLHGAKIDLTHSLGLVRITGSQYVCQSITEVIHDTTMRLQDENVRFFPSVDNKLQGGHAFTPEFLDWIRKTYGVSFERISPYYGPQKILYLAENRQGMEEARRALNLAVYSTNSDPIPFSTYMSSSEPANIYSMNPEEHTSWFERQKAWFRWAMPATQTLVSKPLDAPFFERHQSRLSDEVLKLLRKPATENPSLNYGAGSHETITAAVGKSLFLHKPSLKVNTVDASQLGKMSLPRTFTTDLPRVASFLHLLMPHEIRDQQRLHRVNLVPSAIHAGIFPSLDLEVALEEKDESHTPNTELVVHSAKATMAQNSIDYLLPENGLDLRFTRTIQHDLLSEETREKTRCLIDAVQKRLSGIYIGERPPGTDIPLPSFIPLSIPEDLLPLAEQNSSSSRKKADESTTEAEYMFLPVNDRRGTLLHRYNFHDQRLNYSYYESGPFHPPRATDLYLDVALDKIKSGSSESDATTETMDKFRSFYGTACRLAFELDAAWRSDV